MSVPAKQLFYGVARDITQGKLASQKIEHYEIASYGGLAQVAKTLGMQEVGNLLGETLEEEKEADMLLTNLAENNINESATQEVEE